MKQMEDGKSCTKQSFTRIHLCSKEIENALLRSGEQVLVGATKYQDSTTLNAVTKARVSMHQFTNFKPLTIQYLQQ